VTNNVLSLLLPTLTLPQPTLVIPFSALYQRCVSCSLYWPSLSPSLRTQQPTPTELLTLVAMTPLPAVLLEIFLPTYRNVILKVPNGPFTMSDCKEIAYIHLFPHLSSEFIQGRLRHKQRRKRFYCGSEHRRTKLLRL
jgi:hypothetical protein